MSKSVFGNPLSKRIEELEKENEFLKDRIKDVDSNVNNMASNMMDMMQIIKAMAERIEKLETTN